MTKRTVAAVFGFPSCFGELQQADLGANNLLFGGHDGVSQTAEAGRFATPTAPRPASAIVVPWTRTPPSD